LHSSDRARPRRRALSEVAVSRARRYSPSAATPLQTSPPVDQPRLTGHQRGNENAKSRPTTIRASSCAISIRRATSSGRDNRPKRRTIPCRSATNGRRDSNPRTRLSRPSGYLASPLMERSEVAGEVAGEIKHVLVADIAHAQQDRRRSRRSDTSRRRCRRRTGVTTRRSGIAGGAGGGRRNPPRAGSRSWCSDMCRRTRRCQRGWFSKGTRYPGLAPRIAGASHLLSGVPLRCRTSCSRAFHCTQAGASVRQRSAAPV
jgi:hypothetical protein